MPTSVLHGRPFSRPLPSPVRYRVAAVTSPAYLMPPAAWNFVPKIDIPIFNAGRNQSASIWPKFVQQQSVVNYEQKIQNAFKEVAGYAGYSAPKPGRSKLPLSSAIWTLYRPRCNAQSLLYQHGAVGYIEVLDAERISLFATRQSLLRS